MERYRYIDLLLTIRKEFAKTSHLRNKILSNIRIFPTSFSFLSTSLSDVTKYKSGIALNLEWPEHSSSHQPGLSVIIAGKDCANKYNNSTLEYNIMKAYGPLNHEYELFKEREKDYQPFYAIELLETGIPAVKELLDSKIFDLKLLNTIFYSDTIVPDKRIIFTLDFNEVYMQIRDLSSCKDVTISYNLFTDQIRFLGLDIKKNIKEGTWDYIMTLEKFVELLNTTIPESVIPKEWMEYLDKHLRTTDIDGSGFYTLSKLDKPDFAFKVVTGEKSMSFLQNKNFRR